MSQISQWLHDTQYCTTCGRPFVPALVSHKYDMMRPTCSNACQEEFDQVMNEIANRQRTYIDNDDELDTRARRTVRHTLD